MPHERSALSLRSLALAGAILTGVVALLYVPVLGGDTFLDGKTHQATNWPWSGTEVAQRAGPPFPPVLHYDQVETFYPYQVFLSEAVRTFQVPLWNPYSLGGHPFLANGGSMALYPPRLLLALVVSPLRVLDAMAGMHFLLAGLGMYLLLTYFRLSTTAALIGAAAWMTNSFLLAWAPLQYIQAVSAWLPFCILMADLTVRRRAWWPSIGLGVALTLMVLGGNVLFAELATVAVATFAVTAIIVGARNGQFSGRGMKRWIRGPALRLATGFVIFFGLSAVQLLPALELSAGAGRSVLSYEDLASTRIPIGALRWIFVAPLDLVRERPHDPYHQAAFIGTPAAVLALVGFASRHRAARWASGLVVYVVLAALGAPVLWLAYAFVPAFENFKPLGRMLFLSNFGLAILAAVGLDRSIDALRKRLGERWARSRRNAGAVRPATLATGLATVLVAATVAQNLFFARAVLRHQPAEPDHVYPRTPLIESVPVGDTRIVATFPALPGNTHLLYGIQSGGGYESLPPKRTAALWQVVEGRTIEAAVNEPYSTAFYPRFQATRFDFLSRVGVTHVVTPPNYAGVPDRLALHYSGPDGNVYAVRDAMPRAVVVSRCRAVRDGEPALRALTATAFDPTKVVLVEETQASRARVDCRDDGAGAAGGARVVRRRLNGVDLDVRAETAGFVVLLESWDSGWTATVDGHTAPVLLANFAFRAVPVPPGTHRLSLTYRPRSFIAGSTITGVTLGMVGLAGVVSRRRQRNGAGAKADRPGT